MHVQCIVYKYHRAVPSKNINGTSILKVRWPVSRRMKFIEIFIPNLQNLEVYSISDLPCAQTYSHFLEVQSEFSRYKSRNLWQGFSGDSCYCRSRKLWPIRSTTADFVEFLQLLRSICIRFCKLQHQRFKRKRRKFKLLPKFEKKSRALFVSVNSP